MRYENGADVIEPGDVVALSDDNIVYVSKTADGKIFYTRNGVADQADAKDVRYVIDFQEYPYDQDVYDTIYNMSVYHQDSRIRYLSMTGIGPAPDDGEYVLLFRNTGVGESLGEPVLHKVAGYPDGGKRNEIRLVGVSDVSCAETVNFTESAVIGSGYEWIRRVNNPMSA